MNPQLKNERKKLLTSIEKFVDGPMIFLGFVWLVLLIVELIWGLSKTLEYIGIVIWILFIADFVIEFILAPEKTSFLKKNWLTAISLIIPALRVLRIFRFFRLLKTLNGIRLIRLVSSLNRSMKSLAATMTRRGFVYVFLLTIAVTFAGAAGMYAIEKGNPGFGSYGLSLWWAAMRVITAGSENYPLTSEGRTLAFLMAIYGYAIFGYFTATIASFFIGRDAEDITGPLAGAKDLAEIKNEIAMLTKAINELKNKST